MHLQNLFPICLDGISIRRQLCPEGCFCIQRLQSPVRLWAKHFGTSIRGNWSAAGEAVSLCHGGDVAGEVYVCLVYVSAGCVGGWGTDLQGIVPANAADRDMDTHVTLRWRQSKRNVLYTV